MRAPARCWYLNIRSTLWCWARLSSSPSLSWLVCGCSRVCPSVCVCDARLVSRVSRQANLRPRTSRLSRSCGRQRSRPGRRRKRRRISRSPRSVQKRLFCLVFALGPKPFAAVAIGGLVGEPCLTHLACFHCPGRKAAALGQRKETTIGVFPCFRGPGCPCSSVAWKIFRASL